MMLEMKNIHKSFGGLEIIKGASFSVQKNEICGLVGPNGAGKSTFFNMISGLLHPNSGNIILENKDITLEKPHNIAKLGVGRTFQIARPYKELSVIDNLLPSLMYAGQIGKVSDALEEADKIIELLGLQHKRDTLAYNLTLSERKSLEIAKAVATKPRLLLLDECFAGLSVQDVTEKISLIKNLVKELSITVLIVEHVMKAVMEICDRVVVLSEGNIIVNGTPEEVVNDERVIEVYLGKRREEENVTS